ncbi:GDP-mannose 4,6-dehydratase [Candidatus Uhrbacteria bacterium]|nr:GDP-mannose 4,6-dehydratase [Candidatus Uhrbacteria bacterium]
MSKKRALITGVTGFVGPHLADLLLSQGDVDVMGTYRDSQNLQTLGPLRDRIELYPMDLTDQATVQETLTQARPDYLFHLAAQSNVAQSWKKSAQTFDVNVLGTIHLFEAIRTLALDPVIQIACSSEQYGLVAQEDLPVTEETAFHPLSPYAVSRVTVDLLSYQYFKSYGLQAIRTRAFNHTGPGQGDQFVCSRFAKKIAEIEKGIAPAVLTVGNLEAVRDFTDVRDVVRAYAMSVVKGKPGETYVIASGVGRSIREVLERLLRMSRVPILVEIDPALLRPSDVPALYGASDKFKEATDWKPEIPFEQTLSDLLDYWRARV